MVVQLGLQTLGDDFKDTLFRDIWDKPLCDIFTSKDDAEFAGDCDRDVIGENAKCTSAAFCEGLDDAQRAGTETIIATQLARSVFAFVEGPAGVISQRSSSTDVRTLACVIVNAAVCCQLHCVASMLCTRDTAQYAQL